MFNFELNFSIFPIHHKTVEIYVNSCLLNVIFNCSGNCLKQIVNFF